MNKFLAIFALFLVGSAQATTVREVHFNRSTADEISVDTSALAADDMASNVFQINGFEKGATVSLDSMLVVDNDAEEGVLTIHLFNDRPVVTSAPNAALAISEGELRSKWVGTYRVAAADYQTLASASLAYIAYNRETIKLKKGSTMLFGVIQITSGTPTYTSSDDVALEFNFRSH
jgi:hypothetical protein